MLGFFPAPYPDELLYSVIARYYVQSANSGPQSLALDLFNKKDIYTGFELPSYIGKLMQRLPFGSKYTAEDFIQNNTLYPLYAPFWSPEKSKTIFNMMCSEKPESIYPTSGLLRSSLARIKFFRFCPKCLSLDIEKYGETYWHRLHQISGVYVCHVHQLLLQNSTILVSAHYSSEFNAADEDNCVSSELQVPALSKKTFDKLITLAKDVNLLLNNSFVSRNKDWFVRQYQSILIKLGFTFGDSRTINQKELVRKFIDFYGTEFLSMVYALIDVDLKSNWITQITSRHIKETNSIRHLLLIRFLGIEASNIFEGIERTEKNPYGDGPWVCFNPASEHYLKKVITSCSTKYRTNYKKWMGSFTCSCGFIYSTFDYNLPSYEVIKPTRIIAYGKVWEEKLKRLLIQDKVTFKEAGKQLGLTGTTVKNHAIRLKIIDSEKETIRKRKKQSKNNSKLKQQRRKIWLSAQKKHPTLSRSDLGKKLPTIIKWLYKCDKEWFYENSPQKRGSVGPKSRVEWIGRDNQLLVAVKSAVESMRRQTPPIRINVSRVATHLTSSTALIKHQLHKLPNTKNFLFSQLETTDQFQIRRIHWGATELAQTGKSLNRSRLSRFIGLSQCSDKVKQELAKVVSEFNSKME